MLYTMNQVAELFGVYRSTVWRWVQKGEIKVIPHLDKIMITSEELELFKKNNPKYDSQTNRDARYIELMAERLELEERRKDIKDRLDEINSELNKLRNIKRV